MTIDYEPIEPPGKLHALQELRLPLDMLCWGPSWLGVKSRRSTRPSPVILLPGFGAGPRSMRFMEAFLRRRGHAVRDWGIGQNNGDAKKLRAELRPIVQQATAEGGQPAVLVGWSLGGYIAREYAREHPQEIRKVITLGTPVIGGPRYTATAAWYRSQGHDLDHIERTIADRYATPIQVPVVAVYSKRDGVVAWQACVDQWSPDVRHIEVSETHVGLGFAPRVLSLIAGEIERD